MDLSVELEVDMKGTRHEELLNALREVAQRVAQETGLELVELSLRGSSRRRLLRIDIDRPGPQGVDIDDCQRISSALGEILEADELFEDSYVLEVSSPGMDRPILSPADYRRNIGRRIVVRTREAIDGKQQWKGILQGFEDERIRLQDDDIGEVAIGVDQVESTRQDVEF
jgi:ribosome maturation factor RimP